MKKPSPNLPCPCGSGFKYKKCCQKYHKGALPATALLLMKSRYCAYALGLADYIIDTTHPDNDDFTDDTVRWREEILAFSRGTLFLSLSIITFSETESEAYVTFEAKLSSGLLREKSRFLKEKGKWLYYDGDFTV
ncbi:YchJ family protein [Sulfurovum sp. ST-21]|uniref:SEC-C domain-containing protein n=1 Tax=Sulfurovum indicum TaxID=2779528 RepID=A0A7M1S2B8_9BACT|nr:YchJ family metal-binding protein [Sulfurovum indicum]QOR61518.1 SEC-C domain-containing protein [Sulfurovum indicum]